MNQDQEETERINLYNQGMMLAYTGQLVTTVRVLTTCVACLGVVVAGSTGTAKMSAETMQNAVETLRTIVDNYAVRATSQEASSQRREAAEDDPARGDAEDLRSRPK